MIPRAPIPAESILDKKLLQMIIKEKGALVFTFLDPQFPYKQIDFLLTEDKSYSRLTNVTIVISLEKEYNFNILTITKLPEMKKSVNPLRKKIYSTFLHWKKLRKTNMKK